MKRGFLREILDDVARGKDLVSLFMAPGRSPSQVWMALNTLVDMGEGPLFRKVAAKYRVDPSYLLHRIQGLLHQVEELRKEDPYSLLGVGYTASPSEIHRRWKELMQEWHPDKRGGDPEAQEACRKINEAYELLKDRDRRREYDRRYVPLLAVLKEVAEGAQACHVPSSRRWPRFAVLGLTAVLAIVVLVLLRVSSKGPAPSPSRVAALAPAPQSRPQSVPKPAPLQSQPQSPSIPAPKSESRLTPLLAERETYSSSSKEVQGTSERVSSKKVGRSAVSSVSKVFSPPKVAREMGKKEESSLKHSKSNPFLPRIKMAKERTEVSKSREGKVKPRSHSPVSRYAHLSPPQSEPESLPKPKPRPKPSPASRPQSSLALDAKPQPQSKPESRPLPQPQPRLRSAPPSAPASQVARVEQKTTPSADSIVPSQPIQVVGRFIEAYREGDLSLLLSLFSRNAMENGEPLARYIPRYRLFFKSFKVVEYRLLDRDVRTLGEEVEVKGSYLLSLVSRSGGNLHWVKGSVAWVLVHDEEEGWLIKSLSYTME